MKLKVWQVALLLVLVSLTGLLFSQASTWLRTRYLDVYTNAVFHTALKAGSDGSGADVTFYSNTTGDWLLWDASEEQLVLIGTAGQAALDIQAGNLQLENDELILNSTDADFEIRFDDDATTLGQIFVSSSVDSPNTADNDLFEILFQANDDSSDLVNWVEIEAQIVDVTDDTEDSQVLIKTLAAGSSVTPLTMTGANSTFGGTITVGSAGSGADVQFFSSTSGDHLLYDVSEELLTIIGTDNQDAFTVQDGDVSVTDDVMAGTVNWGGTSDNDPGTDNYNITVDPAPAAYKTGQFFYFKPDTLNTGACNLNVNALGDKAIKTASGADQIGRAHV